MKYAIIENGFVVNMAMADAPQADNWIKTDAAGIGWIYADGVLSAPAAPVAAPIRALTKLQYMNRFTDKELADIYGAAKVIVQVEIWLEKFKLAAEINLDDPVTIGGLQAMEAAGLLAAGRAAEVLA